MLCVLIKNCYLNNINIIIQTKICSINIPWTFWMLSWVRTMSSTNRWETQRGEEGGWTCARQNVSCVVCAIWLCPHKLFGFFRNAEKFQKQCSQTVSDQSSEEKKLLCYKPAARVWAAGQTAGGRAAADNATTFSCVVFGRRLLYQWARWQRMELPKKCKTILVEKELFAVH